MSSIPWRFPRLPLRRLGDALARRAADWARRRQGSDGPVTTLRSGRIYILPTAVGALFALTAFVMLLGSMNYNNSLAFVLTFMLVALGLVAMHHSHRNLAGAAVRFCGADSVFAGDTARFRFAFENSSRSPRFDLYGYVGDARSDAVDVAASGAGEFTLAVVATRRGRLTLPRFGVGTRFPLGLFRAWAWLHSSPACTVWPAPATRAPRMPRVASEHGRETSTRDGDEDFAGLRDYQLGDSPRHVAWKTFARSGELTTKQFAGAAVAPSWLRLSELAGYDLEAALSILARWVVDAEAAGMHYGLDLNGRQIAPGAGRAHRNDCLDALAVFDATGAQSDGAARA